MSIEKITLTKPLLVNGKYLKELTYDIDELTEELMAEAEAITAKIRAKKDMVGTFIIPQIDGTYHRNIAKQAIIAVNPEISLEDLARIKGRDLSKLAKVGQRFFIEQEEQAQAMSDEQQEDTQNTIIAP